MAARRRAFSLIEALVTLALFLIVLAIFASLGREYSRVTHFSSAKQQSMQAAAVGLEGAARELRGAVAIQQPAVGANTTILRFQIVDPSFSDRLCPSSPPPKVPVLNVNAPPSLITLEYTCVAAGLQRRMLNSSSVPVSTQIVADGVSGFSAQRNADRQTAVVAITVPEEHLLRSLTQHVLLLAGI